MGLLDAALLFSVFCVPLLTYLLFTHWSPSRKETDDPLPCPTEIIALYIHPIKSCHGISVPSAKLLPTGLDLDRQWMWVTYPDHKFLTIRQNARMTLIRTAYDAATDTLTVTAPAPGAVDKNLEFSIPAHPSDAWLDANTTSHNATIWSTTTPSRVYAAALTAPFNAFFGKPVRLVYKPPFSTAPRHLASNGAKHILGRDASTCFADMMPILLSSQSSLDELNARLHAADTNNPTLDPRRFRPNILVAGDPAAPWDEDRWKTLCITPPASPAASAVAANAPAPPPLTLDITQRCARCRVPNVHPDTALQHPQQPWDILMAYRRIDDGIKYKPCYGMLGVPRATGNVSVGMMVHVTHVTRAHRYIAGF